MTLSPLALRAHPPPPPPHLLAHLGCRGLVGAPGLRLQHQQPARRQQPVELGQQRLQPGVPAVQVHPLDHAAGGGARWGGSQWAAAKLSVAVRPRKRHLAVPACPALCHQSSCLKGERIIGRPTANQKRAAAQHSAAGAHLRQVMVSKLPGSPSLSTKSACTNQVWESAACATAAARRSAAGVPPQRTSTARRLAEPRSLRRCLQRGGGVDCQGSAHSLRLQAPG